MGKVPWADIEGRDEAAQNTYSPTSQEAACKVVLPHNHHETVASTFAMLGLVYTVDQE